MMEQVRARLSSRRSGGRLLGTALIVVLSGLGGCTVNSAEEKESRVQDVLDRGSVEWDLTEPPSRRDVGMPPDQRHVAYEPGGGETLAVTLLLPNDKSLEGNFRYASFAAYGPDGDVISLDLARPIVSASEARDEMSEAVQRLDLTDRVDDWWEDVQAAPDDQTTRVKSAWMRGTIGYLTVEVQGRYAPHSGSAFVHYLISLR